MPLKTCNRQKRFRASDGSRTNDVESEAARYQCQRHTGKAEKSAGQDYRIQNGQIRMQHALEALRHLHDMAEYEVVKL